MTTWYRTTSRLAGLVACVFVVLVAAQWLSLGFGWDPLIGSETVGTRTDRFRSSLNEGAAILIAAALIIAGVVLFVAWLLAGRRVHDDRTFRVGSRSRRLRVDRNSFAASIERRLAPLDRRVDASVNITRRGHVDLRLVTPDTSVTGTVAEHRALITEILAERNLPGRLRKVDVVDVRKLKTKHRVR